MSPAWNARSVYFDGPDSQVLELIERRDLADHAEGAFGADDLLCVSEVGIAVPDVLGTVDRLRQAGVTAYGDAPSTGFAAVGDVHGMLILVGAGRAWMPTRDRVVDHTPVEVRAAGLRFVRSRHDQTLQVAPDRAQSGASSLVRITPAPRSPTVGA